MKTSVFISLFIFWAALAGLVAAGLLSQQNSQPMTAGNSSADQAQIAAVASSSAATAQQKLLAQAGGTDVVLNMAEIGKHNKASDCWLLISGKIYDVTSSISGHPGGATAVINTCGTDATKSFRTKDQPIGSDHSASAHAQLAQYYVGDLGQRLTAQKVAATVKRVTQTAPIVPAPSSVLPIKIPAGATQAVGPQPVTSSALTLSEVARHNNANDCWMVISGKVYNVTSYIYSHPGGANEIIRACGIDATSAYQTKGSRGKDHSSSAYALLTRYLIGNLNQVVPTSQLQSVIQQTTAVPASARGDDDDDDEDEDDDDD